MGVFFQVNKFSFDKKVLFKLSSKQKGIRYCYVKAFKQLIYFQFKRRK